MTRHLNADHYDSARAELAYQNSVADFKSKNEKLWHLYLVASLSVASKLSSDIEEIPCIAESLADELLRRHKREWGSM